MKTEADYMSEEIDSIDRDIRRKEDLISTLHKELSVCRIKKEALFRALQTLNE